MVLVGVLRFSGYREWTESLGPDREWYIQLVQARTYSVNQSFTAEKGGIVLPLRYDIQLILLPASVNPSEFSEGLKQALKPYAPTPIELTFTCGPIPQALEEVKRWGEVCDVSPRCDPTEVAVAHADLNHFTSKTRSHGPYLTYVSMLRLVSRYAEVLKDRALIQYLGGDNVVAVTDERRIKEVIEVLTSTDVIKVGVGVSEAPREAFSLAAEALTRIRDEGRVRKYLVLRAGSRRP